MVAISFCVDFKWDFLFSMGNVIWPTVERHIRLTPYKKKENDKTIVNTVVDIKEEKVSEKFKNKI